MTKTIEFEASRPVSCFLKGAIPRLRDTPEAHEAFEQAGNWIPPEKFLKGELKVDLKLYGLSPRLSSRFQVEFVEFIEFDSGNIGHACAYYSYRATGPAAIVDILNKRIEEVNAQN